MCAWQDVFKIRCGTNSLRVRRRRSRHKEEDGISRGGSFRQTLSKYTGQIVDRVSNTNNGEGNKTDQGLGYAKRVLLARQNNVTVTGGKGRQKLWTRLRLRVKQRSRKRDQNRAMMSAEMQKLKEASLAGLHVHFEDTVKKAE